MPPDLVDGSSKRRNPNRRNSQQQRRRQRTHRNPDDTLYEIGQVMPTVDFMQEYYDGTVKTTTGDEKTNEKSH